MFDTTSSYVLCTDKVIFHPGRIVLTRLVAEQIDYPCVAVFLARHLQGDWGEISEDDKLSNDEALKNGDRIISCYDLDDLATEYESRLWVITEANRMQTTFMFPSEY